MALKHQWILEPARDHFDTCREEPCHAYVEWSRSSCGTTYADLFIDTLEFTHTAADIRAAMAWYRSTGWLLEYASKYFDHGCGDETASGYIARMREGVGWSWQMLADDMFAENARSADALRAACTRLDEECREAERND
jgi:hypothetical protein